MKKLVLTFFVFVVCLFLAQPRIYAQSNTLFISEIKLGGAIEGQPTEYVELFNDGSTVIDLNAYQLEYAKNSSTIQEAQCMGGEWDLIDSSNNVKLFALSGIIQPRGRLVFQVSLNDGVNGSLRLVKTGTQDSAIQVIDLVGWGDSAICKESQPASMPPNGTSIKRLFNSDGHPIDTNNNKNDFGSPESPLPETDLQPEPEESEPAPLPCTNSVVLSEFMSDPDGLEANGGEFIELHNPGLEEAPLLGCELKSSKSSANLYTFSQSDAVPAGGYFVVNLTDKLTNASGSVTFITADREELVSYSSLKEGDTFALIEGQWKVTDLSTPGSANKLVLLSEEEVAANSNKESELAPCADGKYRSPETNRCRNIESATTTLAPCDPGETRNPETNRCRKITLATSSLAPCNPGEERNPATNRCRKIASTSNDLKPCAEGYERNPETNRCRKVAAVMGANDLLANADEVSGSSKIDLRIIIVVLALAIGYGIYEYRTDLKNLYDRIFNKFSKSRPPG